MIFRKKKQGIWAVSALLCGVLLWAGAPGAMAADSDTNTKSTHRETIPSGIYTIDNVKYEQSMQVSGTSLTMHDKTISEAQKFQITYVGDRKYVIRAYSGDGKRVTTSTTAGSSVRLSNGNSRYYIDEQEDGTYAIIRAGTKDTAVKASSSGVSTERYTGSEAQSWTFDSEVEEDETAVTKKLNKIQKRYPSGSWLGSNYSFAGGYQCMGFGREVFYRLFGTETRWSYDGSPKTSSDSGKYTVVARSSSYSASSMKKLIAKASPGDVLQMNSPKIHTMIFVSSDSNGFTVYDANWTGANQVSVRYVRYGAWSGRNSSGICVLHSTNYPAQ